MVEKMNANADRLLLVLIIEKKFPKYFVKFNFFLFSKPSVVYLGPFLTSLQFQKLKKKNLCTLDINM